ncbi:MAG: hypothetical protein LBV33_01805 [Lachnospiraceae bacterium]|jgi:ABC-2 type transport system permease protein|nr:hypothetical protein [Lachnospiraceae bacterium]
MSNEAYPNKVLLLFKIQMIDQYRLNNFRKGSHGRTERASVFLISMIVLAVILTGYSFSMAYGLGFLGMIDLIPTYAITAAGIASLFFTLLKTNGLLFGYRDYDLLMSLPAATSTVISSRFLVMYCSNMVFTAAVMIPMGAGYALWTKPGMAFYLLWLLGTLVAPLIPTTIGAILGAFVMAFSSRFKYARMLSTLLTVLLLVGSLILSFALGMSGEQLNSSVDISLLSQSLYHHLQRFYPPAVLFSDGFGNGGHWSSLVLFAGLSGLIYLVFVVALAWRYKAINSGVSGHVRRTSYHLTRLSAASPLKALYRKELKRFLSSTIYLTNAGTGAIMALLFIIALTVMGPEQLEATMGMPGFTGIMQHILPFVLAAMLAMACPSSSSLSLEGRQLWIVQSVPAPVKTIFDSKILVNLTLTIPIAVVGGIVLTIRLQPGFWDGLLLFVVPLICAGFSAIWGMYINIKLPRYDWENEITVVKQSAASLVGMLGGSAIVLVAMGVTFLPLGIDRRILALIVSILISIGAIGLYREIIKTKRIG